MLGGSSESAKSAKRRPTPRIGRSRRSFRISVSKASLAHRPQRLDALLRRGRQSTDVRASLPWSHRRPGRPTQRLTELVNAHGGGDWPEKLQELLRREYRPMFEIDLETATPSHFNEAFRKAFRLRTRSSRSA